MTGGCDTVVAGAGPAGSVAALCLARAGRRVLLLDPRPGDRPAGPAGAAATDSHDPPPDLPYQRPRGAGPYRIGETLPPAARPLLRDLGLLAGLSADGHLPCTGTEAAWGSGELYGRGNVLDPHGPGWHLDRVRFDAFLRGAAEDAGARPLCGVAVRRTGQPGAWRLVVRKGGEERELPCAWVVDATGRRAVIARKGAVPLRQDRLVAAYAVLPGPAPADHDLRTLVEAVPDGWWYTARVPAGRLVAHLTDLDLADPRLRTAAGFLERAARTRHIGTRLDGYAGRPPALRWAPAHGQRLAPPAGPGWVAAGDAALACDPLSSQGILTALHTGVRAARAVDRCLRAGGRGVEDALAEYSAFVDGIAARYLTHHARAYADERRWPSAPFWARRHSMVLAGSLSGALTQG
ncbi:tryptophan 7-halogenase [Streptomyces sp. ID05-39B]|uniref:NAD(P)-binding protein n=1 Tax=Streptomyces sp. ID05-39B TaxID=3028664 RepID=UPI0029AAE04B|nr:NAD(P)-binding protein [Streptomyces sp. ID05-39B]MDX3527848.1 tryptophan 7-halogenase [Streptomyces sp. ID05-39B]